MRPSPLASETVNRRGYRILVSPYAGAFDQDAWLRECLLQSGAQILVVDVRDNLSREALDALAGQGSIIAVLDDSSDRRWAANVAFYPPVPQVKRIDWSGFRGRLCIGWEWLVLRSQFALPHALHKRDIFSLIIAMGGSDPAGLTLKAVRALDNLNGDFESVIVVGSGFCHRQSLQDLLARTRRRFAVREDVSEMSVAMAETDLAVCSFGMTAYELAAMGVPSVYSCLTPDHEESASALVSAGVGISVGLDDQGTETRLTSAVQSLLTDENTRARMSVRARELVDGRGASRVAQVLVSTATARQ